MPTVLAPPRREFDVEIVRHFDATGSIGRGEPVGRVDGGPCTLPAIGLEPGQRREAGDRIHAPAAPREMLGAN